MLTITGLMGAVVAAGVMLGGPAGGGALAADLSSTAIQRSASSTSLLSPERALLPAFCPFGKNKGGGCRGGSIPKATGRCLDKGIPYGADGGTALGLIGAAAGSETGPGALATGGVAGGVGAAFGFGYGCGRGIAGG